MALSPARLLISGLNQILHTGTRTLYATRGPVPTAKTGGRPLHFIRGMLHYEPGPDYLATLQYHGFSPTIARYADTETNYLSQWKHKTGLLIRDFARNPEVIGERPVICGHSAGGFTSYVLAAMAKGAELSTLRKNLPHLDDVSPSQMRDAVDQLQGGLFLAIASPLNGITLKRHAEWANRPLETSDHTVLRELFGSMKREQLEAFYRAVGRTPNEVLDGNIVGNVLQLQPAQNRHFPLPAMLAEKALYHGMNFVRGLCLENSETGHDTLVPADAALLKSVEQMVVPYNHHNIVCVEEAANAVVNMVRRLDQKRLLPQQQPSFRAAI